MKAQPQILLMDAIPRPQLLASIKATFGVKPGHVFDEHIPTETDYNTMFEEGYFLVQSFECGDFRLRLDGFFDETSLSDDSLLSFANRAKTLICVDFSRSEAAPHFVAYFGDRKFDFVKVFVEEDAEGDIFYRSQDAQLIAQVRFTG